MNAALLLSLGSKRRIKATLRQFKAGGSATGTGTNGATATTNAVGFDISTLSGSLLVCVVQVSGTYTGTAVEPAITAVTTSGFSWTGIPEGWSISGQSGKCAIYYISSASVMGTSITTAVTAILLKNAGNPQVWVEFQLYEFVLTGTFDTDEVNSGSSSIPSTTNLTTTANDVILVATNSQGASGSTAGPGYTLGLDSSHQHTGINGQLQYSLGINSGSVSTAFGGTSKTNWSAVATAFKI